MAAIGPIRSLGFHRYDRMHKSRAGHASARASTGTSRDSFGHRTRYSTRDHISLSNCFVCRIFPNSVGRLARAHQSRLDVSAAYSAQPAAADMARGHDCAVRGAQFLVVRYDCTNPQLHRTGLPRSHGASVHRRGESPSAHHHVLWRAFLFGSDAIAGSERRSIQVPIAAGMFFHALAAARDNRWRDWLAFGALAGLAVLAKYSSAVLMTAMVCGAIYESSLRKVFRNGRLYAAGVLALSIAAVNLVPELLHPDAVGYASRQFDLSGSLQRRGRALGELVGSIVLYGCPVVLGLIVVAWRGKLRPSWARNSWQTFIVVTALGVILILFLMIMFAGLGYSKRHGIPFFGIWLLALVTVLTFHAEGVRTLANLTLAFWAVLVLGSLIYSQVVVHTVFREPSPAAAKALRDIWDRQFACGPAYVIGDNRATRGIAIYFGRPVKGIAAHELGRSGWFDLEQVQQLGGIVVIAPDLGDYRPPALNLIVADSTKHQLTLPYRRTLSTRRQSYLYYLIAPHGC